MFEFLKCQWVMRRIDEVYLEKRVAKNQIIKDQYEIIITTKQIAIKY
ncbi:hypothetical protein H7E67_01120 [Clostridium gasigenes]|nr:hypothetical protein [Clostridium gasigenes]MBB6622020.1 hypothetical protein [Clostridium gasigenes]